MGSTILIFQGSAQERRPNCWPMVCGTVVDVAHMISLHRYECERQRRRCLDFIEDETGMNMGYAGDRRQFLHQQVFQLLAVADDDLEQVVVFAGDMVAFEHVGQLADAVAEDVDVFARVALEADIDKAEQVEAELFAVEQRGVALRSGRPLRGGAGGRGWPGATSSGGGRVRRWRCGRPAGGHQELHDRNHQWRP